MYRPPLCHKAGGSVGAQDAKAARSLDPPAGESSPAATCTIVNNGSENDSYLYKQNRHAFAIVFNDESFLYRHTIPNSHTFTPPPWQLGSYLGGQYDRPQAGEAPPPPAAAAAQQRQRQQQQYDIY
jgi:hypothetical protein